eukprot:jgi/Ulvmu1/12534/UM090_0021.1
MILLQCQDYRALFYTHLLVQHHGGPKLAMNTRKYRPSEAYGFSRTAVGGKAYERKLEEFILPTWRGLELRLGEPYVLTSKLGSDMLNGSACAIKCFTIKPLSYVLQAFVEHLDTLLAEKDRKAAEAAKRSRPVAWGPVRFSFNHDKMQQRLAKLPAMMRTALREEFQEWGDVLGASESKCSVRRVAIAALQTWLVDNLTSSRGAVFAFLPQLTVRMPSGTTREGALIPLPEVVSITAAGQDVLAVRVQLPVVPAAAVRTATSVLSVTVRPKTQRLDIHCTTARDPASDPDAHNTPVFVALTRAVNAADVAFTDATVLHENLVLPRHHPRTLMADLHALGANTHDHCKVYHCCAWQRSPPPPHPRDSAVHDERLLLQAAHDFFDPCRARPKRCSTAQPMRLTSMTGSTIVVFMCVVSCCVAVFRPRLPSSRVVFVSCPVDDWVPCFACVHCVPHPYPCPPL